MKKRTIMLLAMALSLIMVSSMVLTVFATDACSEVSVASQTALAEGTYAYTRVGYNGGMNLYAIDIVCAEGTEIPDTLSASDFSGMDNLSVSVEGNVVHLTISPAISYSSAGDITCANYPQFNVTIADATEIRSILDDAIYGTYTYAGLTREYALYLPKDENGNIKQNVPLVVWNHGGGEYGTGSDGSQNLASIITASRGFTAWNENGYETAVLQIHVSNANYEYDAADSEEKKMLIDQNNALQADIIRSLIEDGTVDASRVYISGGSSGGGATMRFLMQYPELFAGAIPCCSMDPIVKICQRDSSVMLNTVIADLKAAFQGTVYTWNEETQAMVTKNVDTAALLQVPIRFVHASSDSVVTVETSQAMYTAMSELGDTNNVLTIYSDDEMNAALVGNGVFNAFHWLFLKGTCCHFSYSKMLNDYGTGTPMDWLFQQIKQ